MCELYYNCKSATESTDHVCYQGRHATQDEKAACAFQATALDQKYDDEPVQIRVQMGKEPRHFLAMFDGKLIIHEVGNLTEVVFFNAHLFTTKLICTGVCFLKFYLCNISVIILLCWSVGQHFPDLGNVTKVTSHRLIH